MDLCVCLDTTPTTPLILLRVKNSTNEVKSQKNLTSGHGNLEKITAVKKLPNYVGVERVIEPLPFSSLDIG